MTQRAKEICELLAASTEDEQRYVLEYLRRFLVEHPLEREWGTNAAAIMAAIARSSDLTQRGIRGILAEATFEQTVLPRLIAAGWSAAIVLGDQPYDFLLENGDLRVRVQVKLQRRERGIPKEFSARNRMALDCPAGAMYVVEVQKTRSGYRNGVATRPYQYGDFDILAVNLHPSCGDWTCFRFTIADWLLPRPDRTDLIQIFQPVPECPDEYWTAELEECIAWLQAGTARRLYSQPTQR